jgi:hypothetical protein
MVGEDESVKTLGEQGFEMVSADGIEPSTR